MNTISWKHTACNKQHNKIVCNYDGISGNNYCAMDLEVLCLYLLRGLAPGPSLERASTMTWGQIHNPSGKGQYIYPFLGEWTLTIHVRFAAQFISCMQRQRI